MSERRLIEVDLPLVEVSAQSAREKPIRHGHISTLMAGTIIASKVIGGLP